MSRLSLTFWQTAVQLNVRKLKRPILKSMMMWVLQCYYCAILLETCTVVLLLPVLPIWTKISLPVTGTGGRAEERAVGELWEGHPRHAGPARHLCREGAEEGHEGAGHRRRRAGGDALHRHQRCQLETEENNSIYWPLVNICCLFMVSCCCWQDIAMFKECYYQGKSLVIYMSTQ